MAIFRSLTLICLISSLLMGCEGNRKLSGSLMGAGAGALLGSQFGKGEGKFLAAGLGMLAGAMIGHKIGAELDEKDKMAMAQTSHQALENAPSGQTLQWKNPDSGHYGYITPVKTYKKSGRYCREFTQTVVIGGKEQKAYGTACRQSDGQWEIVSQ